MRRPELFRGAAALAAAAILAGCGDRSPTAPGPIEPSPAGAPVLTSVSVSLTNSPIELGQPAAAHAVALDQFGAPIDAGPPAYASSEPSIAVVNPATGQVLAIAPGTARISATIGGTTGDASLTIVRSLVRINEIMPNGDAPGGWVELYNPTAAAVDLSGWRLGSSDLREEATLPEGTSIPAVGYLVIDEAAFPFGLHAVDSLLVRSRFGVQVDFHFWTGVTSGSVGRCPDGLGSLVLIENPTRGMPNDCRCGFCAAAARVR